GFDGSFESVDYASGQTVAVGKTDGGGTVWLSSDSGDSWVQYEDRLGLFEGNPVNPGGLNVVRAGEEGTFMSGGERTGHPAIWLGVPPEPIPEVDAEGRPLVGWTCQARIDNGAVWQLGEWDEEAGHYVASGVTPCLDLLDVHLEPQQWKVEWEGTARVTEVGFLLWFERGIHGTIYAEREISGETGEWMTPIIEPDPEAPFAWIAMPHSFDDWEEISWTITPCGVSCG
ncbi:MAG: hypothetical protein JRE18_07660, partial [Deltaproteobacteria bacterium]|nr:hypothetical protein [Deltaproteobacteria bacterium]